MPYPMNPRYLILLVWVFFLGACGSPSKSLKTETKAEPVTQPPNPTTAPSNLINTESFVPQPIHSNSINLFLIAPIF